MKKNLNVIQVKGTRGLLMLVGIGCCLAAGFIYFPGWVSMHIWNLTAKYFEQIPAIGILQGILLWGIIAAAYFTFRKEKLVVCMNASEGLDDEELKKVFAEIKKQANNDTLIQSMIKAKEAELKIRNLQNLNIPKADIKDDKEKIESK